MCLSVLGSSSAMALGNAQVQYMSKDDFLTSAFGKEPDWQMLRLNPELKKQIKSILSHSYPASRIRYWQQGSRTAWIIDEIGKDYPITMGVVVENDAIVNMQILVYREERGAEVHEQSFMQQFANIKLQGDGLSREIDSITGATLSVHAVTRVAELALVLHRIVLPDQVANK